METATKYLISDIMTTNLVLLNKSDDLSKAFVLFDKHKIRHLPVMDGDQLIGIISKSDLNKMKPDSKIAVEDLMKFPTAVSPNDSIVTVAKIISDAEYHSLPVIEKGKLLGIVTTTDIIKYLIEIKGDQKKLNH
jgi:CBS domain-containing protein